MSTVGSLDAINIPHYIILGEFGITVLLAVLAKQLLQSNWATALLTGTADGIGIFLCYTLTDGLILFSRARA